MRPLQSLLLSLLFVIAAVSQEVPIAGPFTRDEQRSITIELKHPSSPEHPQERDHHHHLHTCRHSSPSEIRSNFRSDIRRLKCRKFADLGRFEKIMSTPSFIMNINSTNLHNATAFRLRQHYLRCRMLVNSFNILKHPFHRRLFETRGHGAIIRDGTPTLADPHKDVFGLKALLHRGSEFEMCASQLMRSLFLSHEGRYYGYKEGEDRRTADAHHNIDLPLLSFVTGITINVEIQRKELCPICNGTGARNPESIKRCPACHGAKSYSSFRKTNGNSTQSHTKLCPVCDGSGIVHQEPCAHCGGAKLVDGKPSVKLVVKPGTPEGHPYRFEGMAEQRYESITGDVVLHVFSEKHPVFGRDGAHLTMHRNITLMEALLGFEFTVQNIDGSTVTVSRQEVCPPDEKGQCTHEEFGQGLPIFSKPDERGSLKVILHIIMPEKVALSNSSKSTMEKANMAHKKALRKLSKTVLYNGTDDDEGECSND